MKAHLLSEQNNNIAIGFSKCSALERRAVSIITEQFLCWDPKLIYFYLETLASSVCCFSLKYQR